jgi:hypothetical protein
VRRVAAEATDLENATGFRSGRELTQRDDISDRARPPSARKARQPYLDILRAIEQAGDIDEREPQTIGMHE